NDGRVVAAAELLAELRQRGVRQLAREVHGDLARVDDVLGALVAAELLEGELEALGDELLDPRDRDLRQVALREDLLEHVLAEIDGERPAGERAERDDARERALELADVRRDAAG